MYLLEFSCSQIDKGVYDLISTVFTVLWILIPLLLVIFGVLDMAKAVTAGEEKEMKTAQQLLIKRLIYALIAFFVVALVKTVFRVINNNDSNTSTSNALQCIDCFINGSSSTGCQ